MACNIDMLAAPFMHVQDSRVRLDVHDNAGDDVAWGLRSEGGRGQAHHDTSHQSSRHENVRNDKVSYRKRILPSPNKMSPIPYS